MAAAPQAPSSVLASFDEEREQAQRQTLRVGAVLAAGLILAFTALDAVVAPAAWARLLMVRAGTAAVLLVLGELVRRPSFRVMPLAILIIGMVCLPIEAGVFATGHGQSPYLYSMLLPLGAISILVPLRIREVAAIHAVVLLVAIAPLLAIDGLGHWRDFSIPLSYFVSMSIVGLVGAKVQDDLRQREHRARHEAARQSSLANLGKLAGGLAHELSNPLSAVSVELDLIDRRKSTENDSLERLRTGVGRMRDILIAMRQGARVADGQLKPTDLVKQAELALTLVAASLRRIRVERELQALPEVAAQPTLIGQVLVNLLINAGHALQGHLDANEEALLWVRTRLEGERVCLEVEDNGPGVPEELRERIFEPFFSTKGEDGNGLGLWICAEIARFHRGTLTVRAGSRGGALFRLELPIGRATTAPSPRELRT